MVTTGAIRRAKLQSNRHHQQANTEFFLQAGCLSCYPTNSVKALKEKRSQKTNKEINLGYVCVSDEYVLDLEISVNYCRIFRVQIVHAAYHALRNMQLQRPIHLHTKPTNTNINSDLLSAASKLSRDVKKMKKALRGDANTARWL